MTLPAPPRFIFPLLVAITFIAPLSNHMFLPAMPVVKQDFGIGNELAFATLSLTMMTMARDRVAKASSLPMPKSCLTTGMAGRNM